MQTLNADGNLQELEKAQCAVDGAHWIETWAWTYDPREPLTALPLSLFDKQIEFIEWLAEREIKQEDGLVEKSRDMGLTWLCSAYAVHGWLFRDGFKCGFGSRKLDLVDKLDDPDCIFEKIRFLINNLPLWMRPKDYDLSYCKIINRERGSSITGEGGDEIGRGGRNSIYFLDEAAFLERPKQVDRALSQTTRCRIDVSTPNGMGNPFYQRRFSGNVPVFTFHWKDDPRKGIEWYEREKQRLGDAVTVAQELDIDYTASIEGILIPAAWVQSAVKFEDYLFETTRGIETTGGEAKGQKLPREGKLKAGLDIAAQGQNKTVLGFRDGPVVMHVMEFPPMLTTQTAVLAVEEVERRGAILLNYDAGGGYAGTLESMEAETQGDEQLKKTLEGTARSFQLNGINGGDPPSLLQWPDGKNSQQKFVNARAENGWLLRERFRKTHEYKLLLEGQAGGAVHPLDQLISIPQHGELIQQLSVTLIEVTNERRIQLESKKKMRARGVSSPDYFDMLCLLFAAPKPVFNYAIA